MIKSITTIQEITLQACAFGVFDYLFNKCNKSRGEILNMFVEWAKEFEEGHKDFDFITQGFYYDEIDAFVNKKFDEIRLSNLFPGGIAVGDYLTYEGGLYKITGFKSGEIVVDELRPGNDKDWIVCTIGLSQADKIKVLYFEEVMDTTNGHNPELVKKINIAWSEKCEKFYPILCALYERDIDEITNSDAFQLPEWIDSDEHHKGVVTGDWSEYNTMALNQMKKEWDFFAINYLQHIADDTDLETILTFIRYED
jgi:hypothetical protein